MHNINDLVRVRFSKEGWLHVVARFDEMNALLKERGSRYRAPLPEIKDGFVEDQLWEILSWIRGYRISMCDPPPFSDIEFVEKP